MATRLKGLLYEAAQVNRWWIHELAVQPDHIHMLVQLDAATSVARAAQVFKGGTSHVIRREFPELEEFLWGDSLWADGYFAESIGITREEAIRRYIREQRKHDPSMPPS